MLKQHRHLHSIVHQVSLSVLLRTRPGHWDNATLSAGPPPVLLDDGNWLVLYNVDCNNIHHLELARSLCEGRNIYISNQKRWIELTDLTVCIESSSKMRDDTPELLTALVSKVIVLQRMA